MATRLSRALAVAALLALAGCSGAPGTTTTTAPTTADAAPPTTATTTAATTATTSGTVPYGTEFVSVEPVDSPPDAGGVAFESLSEPRREVFLRALEEGQLRFAPGEDPPFSFHNESRPEFVRYEGDWYFVRVSVV